mmetsp:Transcript_74756/g.200359  ORF Transcript_74756/g.200359 Transcript_74756/m.200359 type:complete len:367 (+) Transcript_74756:255-1355(+)
MPSRAREISSRQCRGRPAGDVGSGPGCGAAVGPRLFCLRLEARDQCGVHDVAGFTVLEHVADGLAEALQQRPDQAADTTLGDVTAGELGEGKVREDEHSGPALAPCSSDVLHGFPHLDDALHPEARLLLARHLLDGFQLFCFGLAGGLAGHEDHPRLKTEIPRGLRAGHQDAGELQGGGVRVGGAVAKDAEPAGARGQVEGAYGVGPGRPPDHLGRWPHDLRGGVRGAGHHAIRLAEVHHHGAEPDGVGLKQLPRPSLRAATASSDHAEDAGHIRQVLGVAGVEKRGPRHVGSDLRGVQPQLVRLPEQGEGAGLQGKQLRGGGQHPRVLSLRQHQVPRPPPAPPRQQRGQACRQLVVCESGGRKLL